MNIIVNKLCLETNAADWQTPQAGNRYEMIRQRTVKIFVSMSDLVVGIFVIYCYWFPIVEHISLSRH